MRLSILLIYQSSLLRDFGPSFILPGHFLRGRSYMFLPGPKSNFLLLYYISFHSSSQEVCQIFLFSNICSAAGLHNIIIVYYRRVKFPHLSNFKMCRPPSNFSSCQILCSSSCKRAAKELRLSNFKRAVAAVKF